jgi:hypothetical protein
MEEIRMHDSTKHYWQTRLAGLKEALEANHFEVFVAADKIGNRVGGITFGPKAVVILVGRNKIVPDLEDAMFRIKNLAAPANAIRLNKSTPCAKTSRCEDCNSPERICNVWTIVEKSFPRGRVKVILINEELGL